MQDKPVYEFKRVIDDEEIKITFNGHADVSTVYDNLYNFLRACGWSDELIKEILREAE